MVQCFFKDAYSGKNLHKVYVKTETNQHYADGIGYLIKQGFTIKAIVCDGHKGLLQLFPATPIQMCQFHQAAIIRRYLTKKPKMQAVKSCGSMSCFYQKQIKKVLKVD